MMLFLDVLKKKLEENKPVVLITVVDAESGSPGKPGFKMIVSEKGREYGTIGGGPTEFHAISKAESMIKENTPWFYQKIDLSPSGEEPESLCGGSVTIYYELFIPQANVFIFGAGHVGLKLAALLKEGGYSVTLLDNREDAVKSGERNSGVKCIQFDYKEQGKYETLPLNKDSYAVILTHQHVHDYDVLKSLYISCPEMKYIGMIGSKTKVAALRDKIKEEVPSVNLGNLYSPVGIKLGGDSAFEIAISITAEIQAVKYGKAGSFKIK